MKEQVIATILKAPLVILVILAFLVGFYAAFNKLYGVGYPTPIILLIVIILYFIGVYISKKRDF